MVGAVPRRFRCGSKAIDLATYFAMARGTQESPPLDMTKWFDTNYHYLSPEFEPQTCVPLGFDRADRRLRRGHGAGHPHAAGAARAGLLPAAGQEQGGRASSRSVCSIGLLPVYEEVIRRLAKAGAEWMQIDEPVLTLDLPGGAAAALEIGLWAIGRRVGEDQDLPGHVFWRSGRQPGRGAAAAGGRGPSRSGPRPEQLDPALDLASAPQAMLSLGVIDGRNVWRADLERRVQSAGKGRRAVRRRAAHGRPVLLALALPDRSRRRERRWTPSCAAGWPSPSRNSARSRSWPAGCDEGRAAVADALSESRDRLARPPPLAANPPPGGERAVGRPSTRRCFAAQSASPERAQGPAGRAAAAAAAHHDHRLLPANGRSAQGPGGPEEGRVDRGPVRGLLPQGNRADRALPGGNRPRRAGPRRVRAERHGRILRRAVGGLRLHRQRLGAELRRALRQAADHLRRRLRAGGR